MLAHVVHPAQKFFHLPVVPGFTMFRQLKIGLCAGVNLDFEQGRLFVERLLGCTLLEIDVASIHTRVVQLYGLLI